VTLTSRSLFDRWSYTYDGPGFQWLTYRPVHDAVLERLNDVDPAVVVDLGCGTGRLTERLRRRFPAADVIGFDVSAGMLAKAGERLDGVGTGRTSLVRADAHRLPLAPDSIDLIVCTESFHWYQDQARVLDGAAAALRPGGRLVIASIATVTELGDRLVRRSTVPGGNEVRAVPPRRLRELLQASEFEVAVQRRIPRLGLVAWPVLTEAILRSTRASSRTTSAGL